MGVGVSLGRDRRGSVVAVISVLASRISFEKSENKVLMGSALRKKNVSNVRVAE